jgi:hypothetical protein
MSLGSPVPPPPVVWKLNRRNRDDFAITTLGVVLGATNTTRNVNHDTAQYVVPSPRITRETPAERFTRLAAQWKRETSHLSSLRKKTSHVAYQSIISMGLPAVPLILDDLKSSFDDWSTALTAITGVDPVPVAAYGKAKEVAKAWLRWAKENRGRGATS